MKFLITDEQQTLPWWLIAAIERGDVTVKGDSTSDVQYYHIAGNGTAGPGDTLEFLGGYICIIKG